MAIALIRKAEKKFFKYENEYKENPSLETAFEIEKNGRRAIYLTENTVDITFAENKIFISVNLYLIATILAKYH